MASIHTSFEKLRPSAQFATKQWLKERYDKLSVRTRNCIPGADNIDRALYLLKSVGSDHELLSIKNCGTKTLLEIKKFLGDFRNFLAETANLSKSAGIELIPDEKLIYDTLEEYPFLTLDDCREIARFISRTGHHPFIHIIRRYVEYQLPKDRNVEIISRHYGVMPGSAPEPMDTLGATFGMTRERVRQIVGKGIYLPERLYEEMSRNVTAKLDKINSLENPLWKNLSEKHSINDSPREVAILVCAVLGNYTLVHLEGDDYEYLICRDILKNSTLKTAFAKLKICLEQRRTEMEEISIMEYLCNGNKSHHPEYNLLKSIIASYVRRRLGLEVEDDDRIIATPNKIDNFEAMESVLQRHGKPMSAEQMWDAFQKEYPNAGIKKFTSFKAYLIMNPKILARGKTGTYAHSDWDHYFVGSIMEFVAHTITKLHRRVSIDELIGLISHEYGEMSRSNLVAALRMDPHHEYVIYDDDYIGIRGVELDNNGASERRVVRRISFGERMKSLTEFINKNGRMPYSSDDELESGLSRWIYNMNHHKLEASNAEYELFNSLMQENSSLPHTRLEYRFRQKCLLFIEKLGQDAGEAKKLNTKDRFWIRKNIRDRKHFAETDPRCRYIDELEAYLDKIGYKI